MLGAHLGEETINALIDRSLAPQEAASVRAHIDACDACRATFVEMRATRELLRGLPAPLPSRSFQLGPEYLSARQSVWTRLASVLMPALPALRAATVAVALLLAAVSLRNAVNDPASRGPVSEAPMIAQTDQLTQVTEEDQNTAALESNQGLQVETLAPIPTATLQPTAQVAVADDQARSGTGGAAPTATLPPFAGGDSDEPAAESAPAIAADSNADDAVEEEAAESAAGTSFEEPAPTAASGTLAGETGLSQSTEVPADAPSDAEPFQADDSDEATDAFTEGETGANVEAQESTTLQVDEGDGAANAAPAGEPSLAMIAVPAEASPTPASTATAIVTVMSTATATIIPSAMGTPSPLPSPMPTVTPVTAVEAAPADGRDNWEIAQGILAVLLVLLILLLGAIALGRRRAVR